MRKWGRLSERTIEHDLSMRKPRVEIVSDVQDLADRMVERFISAAVQAVEARGVFHTALSGGRTPELFFRRLTVDPQAKAIRWDKTHVFWVDERYVPTDSQDSNYRLAAEALLNKIKIPEGNVHRIPTEYAVMGDAVRAYERTIREVFGLREGQMPQFDLIVLGMGSDGHTASLFPNSPVRCDAADLACVACAGVGIRPQVRRITLTPSVLLAARSLVVLVSGQDKARTLREVFAGKSDETRYPIRMLWPVLDRVAWLVDRDAASLISDL